MATCAVTDADPVVEGYPVTAQTTPLIAGELCDYWAVSWYAKPGDPRSHVWSADDRKVAIAYFGSDIPTEELSDEELSTIVATMLDDALVHGWDPESEDYEDLPDNCMFFTTSSVSGSRPRGIGVKLENYIENGKRKFRFALGKYSEMLKSGMLQNIE